MNANTLVVTPSAAASAYQRTNSPATAGTEEGFGATLERALGQAVTTGQEADATSMAAVVNGGDLTHVVTAVSKAQLALQEVVAIRDKVVSAYQEVMRMSI